jgi:alcohol oxidase
VCKDGKRQDAAHCYIHPLLHDGKHPNLHLLLESKVIRVIFDKSNPPQAVGVEYKSNKNHQPELSLSKPVHHIINANKLVIVAAGALGTPQILERSGVGNPEVLKRVGVPVVANVPGVGENYQDHNLLFYPYKSSLPPEETLDGIFSGRKDFTKAIEEKDPQLGWNGIGTAQQSPPPHLDMTD